MIELRLNLASDINRACEQANEKADEAIGFAKLAGTLLLEAKAALPHGEWLPWLEANVWVTPRQAQRYMQVAQGRPLPVRSLASTSLETVSSETAKTTPVSHLEVDAPRLFAGDADAAEFVPAAGYCYAVILPDTTVYAVEPSLKHPGYFFVSKMDAATDMVDYTRRPVAAGWVEVNLQYFGLENPSAVEWRMKPSAGVLEALDTFPGCAA
ncbi:hypothetical protein H6CHR_03207 [Variovorax sp. PBL-H6]|uniref:DUF3102 domain-containing protein n=1 Tax=Variovorax sp. PBL-H6 TaxID=434009 RepID=UPI0013196C07|nr:DUF3102 domain-containing protein [Variovorax sp. PBL-H6]VTU29498.1 hypothetical protein H6CHR_03207 [Variovorax sp. PBL-H6]